MITMKRSLFVCSLLIVCSMMSFSQKITEMPVWKTEIPLNNGITEKSEIIDNRVKTNIAEPKMTVYQPDSDNAKQTDKAILICPGGGYAVEAIFHEGHRFAEWLVKEGISAAVLEYRLPNKHHEIPLLDVQQAIRELRSTFFQGKKIGISGFSAGGHLASTAGTHFDVEKSSSDEPNIQSCRPDFMVLFYPVITMDASFTHMGSRRNLLGENPGQDLVDYYSNEKQVSAQTPPTLLFLSDDDKTVVPKNSIEFYNALKESQIPASMYIFPTGGHGWGMNVSFNYHEIWKSLLLNWLDEIK